MCVKSGMRIIVCAGALALPAVAPAQAQGVGVGGGGPPSGGGGPAPAALPGVGVQAYAPGQGPTGAGSWNGGSWNGYTRAYGPFWSGYYGGGGGAGGGVATGGASALNYNLNYIDNRRRDGGFYGGGGVFYGDDGYSRREPVDNVDTARPPKPAADESLGVVRASTHIIYLPDNDLLTRRGALPAPSLAAGGRRPRNSTE